MRAALMLLALPPLAAVCVASDITWTNVGPGGGGLIQSICLDPADASRIHLGCDVGGYYRSDDLGGTWTIRNTGLTDYFVQCLAVCPDDPAVILAGCEGGLHRSADWGATWEPCRTGFPAPDRWSFSAPISALAFVPSQTRIVYAGIGRPRWGKGGAGAVYRSDDRGQTWRLCPRGQVPADAIITGLDVAPDGSFILAATDQGLYRSRDGGETWTDSGTGLAHRRCVDVAISPSDPEICYLTLETVARGETPFDGGVYRSSDGGLAWERRSDGLPARVGPEGGAYQLCSGYREIAVSPKDANTVYVGSTAWVSPGVYTTTDGGASWGFAGPSRDRPGDDYGWIRFWGPTIECLAISPADPSTLVCGTSGHVFVTRDGAATWRQAYCSETADGRFSGHGLEVTCLNNVVFDPLQPERLYGCYFDIGLLVSDDLVRSFRKRTNGMGNEGNTFAILADPAVPGTLWASTGEWVRNTGDLCRSADGGETWTVVGRPETGLPDGQTRTLLLDPASPPEARRLLVTVKGHGVYVSDDSGESWRGANEGLPEAVRGGIAGLVAHAEAPQVLRCLLGGKPDEGSGVYESSDSGASWRKVSTQPIFGDCQQLVSDPGDLATLYACLRETATAPGGLWRSADGGRTFNCLYDYHFAQCVAVSPRDRSTLYLGLNDHPFHDGNVTPGLLVSRDGGATWSPEMDGLTSSHIASITVSPHDPRLIAVGTGGNGVFIGRDARP